MIKKQRDVCGHMGHHLPGGKFECDDGLVELQSIERSSREDWEPWLARQVACMMAWLMIVVRQNLYSVGKNTKKIYITVQVIELREWSS
jgi:hypothetical protein